MPISWSSSRPQAQCHGVHESGATSVRAGGVDYSLPPGLAGRRASLRLSLSTVTVCVDGRQVAAHRRSWVPADVVIDPVHARALRLAREAKDRLADGDVDVPTADLAAYDALLSGEGVGV